MSEKLKYLDLFSGIQPAALPWAHTGLAGDSLTTTSARWTHGRSSCIRNGFPTRYRWVT